MVRKMADGKKQKKKKKGIIGKIILLIFILGLAGGGYFGWDIYQKIYAPNVSLGGKDKAFIYIPTGAAHTDVVNILYEEGFIVNRNTFEWVVEQKNYQGKNVVPGKYEITDKMNNEELINHLRAGNGRLEVSITFNNVRTKEQLAGKISKNIEADSLQIIDWLNHPDSIGRYGFNDETILTLFLPNSYRVQWNTSASQLMKRMGTEYKKFWTAERKQKASDLGLSQSEVSVLASIVQAEQSAHPDECPRIAGLYLNRLKKGMLLQSDPTVIYGIGDFSIRRVLHRHLEYDSPYNTYKYKGLPPGPINLPELSSLDAVLNAEKHKYIFMCAKPRTGGYHNFAETYNQHLVYAREYQRWIAQQNN